MRNNVLFITRNGLLEPLGQSQILSYLIPLSKENCIHIISFEKYVDLEKTDHFKTISSICSQNSIKWTPLKYRKTFRQLGIFVGFFELFFKVVFICRKERINVIHARSYYPSFIALLINYIFGTPFIFDMRALWPEELVEAGRLKKGGVPWKVIKLLEKQCLKNSTAIVSLTYAAVKHLQKEHSDIDIEGKTSVIPTCANLSRFVLKTKGIDEEQIVLSCIGSMLSGWFKINVLKEVIDYMLSTNNNVTFEFLTRDDKNKLLSSIDPEIKWRHRMKVEEALFSEMPEKLASHDGSMFFFTANISKLGSAPTRMAEILGTGIPVLTNAGVGDVDKIILENKVGQLLDPDDIENIHNACDSFMTLIKQDGIAMRCRQTSEALFSLESGVDKYKLIYSKVPV